MAAFIKGTDFEDIPLEIKWYERQLKKLGVRVKLGTEVGLDLVKKEKPDAVVVAVGGRPVNPTIKGMDSSIVVTTLDLEKTANKFVSFLGAGRMSSLSKIYLPVGKHVVVVGGSDLAGIEAVEFLVKRGKTVTFVDNADHLGSGLNLNLWLKLYPWLEAKGVNFYNSVAYDEITREGMSVITREGKKMHIPADTVMIITDFKKNDELYNQIKGLGVETYLIGDAKEDGCAYIVGSTYDGARVGCSL